MAVHPTRPHLPARPVLLTRPRDASLRLAADLAGACGDDAPKAEVLICPLMEIAGTGIRPDLRGIAGIVLTSANAVPFLPKADLPAYCVGQQTAAAASAAGFRAHVLGPDAEGLVASLTAARPRGPLLHAHGTHLRGDIATRLTASGLPTRAAAVYDQRALAPGPDFALALRRSALLVPLFSPRSARLFAQAAGQVPADAGLIALSPAVADALPAEWRAQTTVLPRPDGGAMLTALCEGLSARICP